MLLLGISHISHNTLNLPQVSTKRVDLKKLWIVLYYVIQLGANLFVGVLNTFRILRI